MSIVLALLLTEPAAAASDTSSAAKSAVPAGSASAAAPKPRLSQPAANRTKAAPADMYFGPFGMSPLSIRSKIGFLGRQFHYRTISDGDVIHQALDIESALRKWRAAYPADPWLAPTFFHLEQLYQAVQTDEARKRATALLQQVARDYPDTKQGHLSRSRLAAGFPPLVAETPVVASPAPAATPTPLAADNAAPPGASATGAVPAKLPLPAGSPAAGVAAPDETPPVTATAAP